LSTEVVSSMKLARHFEDLRAKLNFDGNQVASAVNGLDESDQQMEYSNWNWIEIDLLMNVSEDKKAKKLLNSIQSNGYIMFIRFSFRRFRS